jgi:hypothetical protein
MSHNERECLCVIMCALLSAHAVLHRASCVYVLLACVLCYIVCALSARAECTCAVAHVYIRRLQHYGYLMTTNSIVIAPYACEDIQI